MSVFTGSVQKRWSVVFAFIPVIHVIYLLFNFIFAQCRRVFYLWAIPLALAIGFVLLRLLPQTYAPLAYYLVFTVLAVIQHFKCKGCAYAVDRRLWLRAIIVVLPVVLFLGLYISINSTRRDLENTVENIVNTAISKDNNEWFELLHPKCDGDIANMTALSKKLRESGIQLTGTIEDIQIRSFKTEDNGRESCTWTTAVVRVGGDVYELQLLIYKDRKGEGLLSLDISEP